MRSLPPALCAVLALWTGASPSVSAQVPNPTVLPAGVRVLRAEHRIAPHSELRCVRCHEGAGASDSSGDVLQPPESACLPCHEAWIDRTGPQAGRCVRCHRGFDPAAARSVPASSYSRPELRFSHAAHVRSGSRCLDCHRADDGSPTAYPTMERCLRCHGGPSPGPGTCTRCHAALPDGRMRSRYGAATLTPPGWLGGMDHGRDWIVRHRWVGADQGRLCAVCHTESECASCHDGRVRPAAVHPNDWLTIHPQLARRGADRCVACHSTQTFCMECHARLGISTISAPNVRSGARYHPSAASWTRGPALHGIEARRSMAACASCHAERDCVTCHGAGGIGSGLSPHAADFASRCAPLLRANNRACALCHGDVTSLAGRCR